MGSTEKYRYASSTASAPPAPAMQDSLYLHDRNVHPTRDTDDPNNALHFAAAEPSTSCSFQPFPKLPIELQRMIWYFACIVVPQSSASVHTIAPDPASYFRDWEKEIRIIQRANKDPQLKILRERLSPIPSLLHASRESRKAASRLYDLWPTAKASPTKRSVTYRRDRKYVYVHRSHDIMYFSKEDSEYWFLDLMYAVTYDEDKQTDEWNDISGPAFTKFLDQMSDVQHVAINCEVWLSLLVDGNCKKWLQRLSGLRDLSLVIEGCDPETMEHATTPEKPATTPEKPAKFMQPIPDTIRAASAKLILEWSQRSLSAPSLEFRERTLPELHVVTLFSSHPDNHSSENDKDFAEDLRLSYRMHSGWIDNSG